MAAGQPDSVRSRPLRRYADLAADPGQAAGNFPPEVLVPSEQYRRLSDPCRSLWHPESRHK